ncbi:uncharacterized protein STEHIDRAFT_124768 [Stereum hirsutum FP-91666 SS1]|uniref:uncharacterized protein n=1 Tax=Stereum hirsutum (strain FP-91666) TaxID=721885 RepID=UPI00044498D6|nr:uncharacterized protein STEHIDRAFT_124768 [Stereum hirsutum FP-91666 SS1]EIM81902.1 hypothetical protein STEHIDRAFT_124768 [Stereum hirsutum FP-91666 SS1]
MSRCLWLQELTIVIDDFPRCEIPSWENWVARVAAQISSLRLDLRRAAVLTDSSTLKALKLSKNLVSLSLSFPPNYGSGTPWEPTNEEPYTLDFPQLRELQYFLWTRQYAEALEIFAQSISAPKLEALTLCLVQRGRIDIEYKEISSSILVTLSFLGDSLRYLHLAHQSGRTITLEDDQEWRQIWDWTSLWSNDRFQALVNLCPYLEHFVAPLPPDSALIGIRHHPTLRYIDAWVPPFDIDNSLQTPVCLVPDVNAFPFLRRCRHLDASLNVFMDLPTIFPPRDPTTADDRLVQWTTAGSVKVLESDCYIAPPAARVYNLHSNRPALDAYRTRSDREIDEGDVSSDSESGGDIASDEPMQVDSEQLSAIDSDESDDDRYIPDDESNYSGSSEYWSDEGGLDGIGAEGTVLDTDVRPATEADTIMASTTIIPGYFGQVLADLGLD